MTPLAFDTRIAQVADAATIAELVAEGLSSYRSWAPAFWRPPLGQADEQPRFARALSRDDVWCMIALVAGRAAGHVALSLLSAEDPNPPPAGTVNLWQLFVRPPWQGTGLARELMRMAIEESRRRGFTRLRLWTPQGARQARRFYEREGWSLTGAVHEQSGLGLPVVEYERSV
jgi:GNAT superfamily N-acetyltransferase